MKKKQISRKADLFLHGFGYNDNMKIEDHNDSRKENRMGDQFYRLKRGRVFAGVLAGLSDKFNWDLSFVRVLFIVACFFEEFPIIIYVILAIFLPYKEDIERERFGEGKRHRKNARPVDSDDGWFW